MEVNTFFIRSLKQKDRYRFTIEWTDGKLQDFHLSDLQKQCTCMRCRNTETKEILADVEARQIISVGNYALQIEFAHGCSKGIYPFWLLRRIGNWA
jgi:DUF971 family protein